MSHSIKQSIERASWAVLILALLSLFLRPAPAMAYGGYGDVVDAFCLDYDGSTPYAEEGCALCHSGGFSTPTDTWAWFLDQQYSLFCTGTPENRAPNGVITLPSSDPQVEVGELLTFEGSGTDPDGDALTYQWDFGVSTATGPGPHSVIYGTAGTYSVSLVVSDGTLEDPTPATRTIHVETAVICTDADQDGFSIGAGCEPLDCDDTDPSVNPNATERCDDGIDNNCDGRVDDADPLAVGCALCFDSDGDGFSPDGGVCGPADCDDTDPAVNPGVTERCDDGIDNDCDFYLDDTDSECNGRDCLGQSFPVSDLELLVSDDPYLDFAEPLDGLTLSGRPYIFVNDEPGIMAVRYYLDDRLYEQLERAPWSLGGSSKGVPEPFDTRDLDNGWHRLRVEVDVGSTTANRDDDEYDDDGRGKRGKDDRDRRHKKDRGRHDDEERESIRTQTVIAGFQAQNLTKNRSPICIIESPAEDVTIRVGETVDFTGGGEDADGDLPLSFNWDFDGGAADASVRDPGPTRFNEAGRYRVTLTVSDVTGLPCAPSAEVTVVVESGEQAFTAHPITWDYVKEDHKKDWEGRPNACIACHGSDFQGTDRSATFAERTWPSKVKQADGSKRKHYARGELVGCLDCHRMPEQDEDDEDDDKERDRDD